MNYKQCLIFQKVAETENFTKAAAALFLTQSAVSHAIKDLEREAGVSLFERLHRSVRLTSAGQEFLKSVTPLIETFDKTESHLQQLHQNAPLHLAVCMTYAEAHLPEILQTFQAQHPRQKTTVTILPAEDCFQLLAAGKADLAILEGSLPSQQLISQQIGDYPLVAVAANDFPRQELTLAAFLKEKLLLREPGSAPRETLAAALLLKELPLNPAWESLDTASLISGVVAGLGVSLLPQPLVAADLAKGRLKALTIHDLDLHNHIWAVVRETELLQGPLLDLWQLLARSS